MEGTPKLRRKTSLSLGRLNKRHCSSPKECLRSAQSAAVEDSRWSPAPTRLTPNARAECTPPSKKTSLDASLDYSPRVLDESFSPSSLLSQTLAVDSPEVGWRWGRRSATSKMEVPSKTPDSAYAADSSFASAGSSGTEAGVNGLRKDSERHLLTYNLRREEQRKHVEVELRRAEKSRVDELLMQRCARLQEQLKDTRTDHKDGSYKSKLRSSHTPKAMKATALKHSDVNKTKLTTSPVIDTPEQVATAVEMDAQDKLGELKDFFNDSDSDCLLLAVTQQLESKMVELTQTNPAAKDVVKSPVGAAKKDSTPASKDKRSSLYMKFLEDDSSDDWFATLDDVSEQAIQAKKPRTTFQRYKSMPLDTSVTETGAAESTATPTKSQINGNGESPRNLPKAKMKRHVSSNAFSPSSSRYPAR